MLTQESCPAGHDLECRYTHIVPCEGIPQKFSDGGFGATRRHCLSILPRLPACAVSASPEPSVYKCGKCLRNPVGRSCSTTSRRRPWRHAGAVEISPQLNWRCVIERVMCAEIND